MRHLLRPVATLAAGVLVSTTLAAGPAEAAPADRGADWLQRQLKDGLIYNRHFQFTDYGLTADVALALDYLNEPRAVRRISRALDNHVDSWTTGADFGSDDVYAGSVAKAVVVAQSAERNPRRFGGVNLVRRLERRVSDTEPYVGRIEDRGATDYANTIGQAFAAVGLADAGSDRAADVRQFLLAQQCATGFFRLQFAAKSAPEQDCDSGDPTVSVPDTDATAIALLSLENLPHKNAAVRAAIDDAVGWLKRAQKDNGSFGGGVATEASNANSTGLAAWALGDGRVCRPAAAAAQWVNKLQVPQDARRPLAREGGAIAYDRTALRAAREDGIGKAERDQWRRATAQAAPGLTFLRLRTCRG